MRRSKQISIPTKPTFAIIGDGECEFWYFQMLKRNERSLRVDIKPEIPQKKTLKDQFIKVIEYSKDYSQVFWIVDFDVIISESRVTPKGKKTAIQEFKEYYYKLKKDLKNVTIILNNPCLEFWILLHFEDTSRYFNTCEGATKQLLKHLPDYEKTEKYYTKQNNDIYLKLKSKLDSAIKNAQKLDNFDLNNPETAISQMHLIFKTKELQEIASTTSAK